jgi:hypothetical protein
MKPPSFLPEDSWANPRLTEHRGADDQRRVARLSDLHALHNGAKVPAPMAPTSCILARSAGRNPPRPVIPTREHVNQKESALLSRGAQPVTHPHRPRNPRHQPGVAPPEVSRTVHNTWTLTLSDIEPAARVWASSSMGKVRRSDLLFGREHGVRDAAIGSRRDQAFAARPERVSCPRASGELQWWKLASISFSPSWCGLCDFVAHVSTEIV